MRQVFLALLLVVTAFFLADTAAVAKPKPKPHADQVQPAQQEEQPAEEAPPPPDTSWKGVVGGWVVAVGADGLAAKMDMQPATFGILAALILLGILVILILSLMSSSRRRRSKRRAVYAGDYSNSMSSDRPARAEPKKATGRSVHEESKKSAASAAAKSKSRVDVPDDFDLTKFLRAANALFLRLQSAWDNADLGAVREFANDEIHEELRLQLRERGETLNKTTVVSFDSKLLKLDHAGKIYTAVVKFSGSIREENHPPKPFMEVWSVTKPKTGSDGWIVTAIQQFI
jgi:predicted lipid-binding transport protein (Tim44 family)